jgi:hypothetical protein
LKTKHRPKQVFEFLAWHRQLERRPAIKDVGEYGDTWVAWYHELKAKPNYQDMIKGGGNGIFLLILTLKWWADETDELDEGNAKDQSNNRLKEVISELARCMTEIIETGTFESTTQASARLESDSETETRPNNR